MTSWIRGIVVLVVCALLACGAALALTPGALMLGGAPLPAVVFATAMGVNLLVWVPSALARTEHFFDLTGSLTYLSVTGLCLAVAAAQGVLDPRRAILGALVGVWAVRLGIFLFRRVRRAGKDGRFDALKQHPGSFLVPWALQGLWVSWTALAAVAVWTRAEAGPALGLSDLLGLALWALGFGVEVVADRQKTAFRAAPANAGRFIATGLWAWSRHPNYFGEILLWTGVLGVAAPALEGWAWVAASAPAFVALLLIRISGVPLLEARADERWGGDEDYEAYKARTPVLWLRPPRR